MDISQFKKEFMDEANKQLAVMNNSLNNLNEQSLTEFSNANHVLKSSAATMGFMQISELTKTMESVLNEIIKAKIEITPIVSEILAECVSALAELIKTVDEGKEESDVNKLVAKLKNIIK